MTYSQHLEAIHRELKREYPNREDEIGDLCFRIERLINAKEYKWKNKPKRKMR